MWEPFLYFSPLVLFSLAYISLAMELARVKTRIKNEGKKDEVAAILVAQIQELENDIENLLEQERFGELSADGLVYNVMKRIITYDKEIELLIVFIKQYEPELFDIISETPRA